MSTEKKIERVSVVVPVNPFKPIDIKSEHHCLCALDVERLMEWWPGLPHIPNRNAEKVKTIQRSLDWKRVAQIATYLLQQEIENLGALMNDVFFEIYNPRKNDPGREWPPKIRGAGKYEKSSFPFLSNVLVHVNGAEFTETDLAGTAELGLDPTKAGFNFTVIDGQHRINGAYLALKIRQKTDPLTRFELPAEVFLDLDGPGAPPTRQAQIFIDVNLYQKKVDRSLVHDLFPLARGNRQPLDRKDRSQDIGRRLMLETGPLIGMIQIPGIKYGVKDVVTLATLNAAIEGAIPALDKCDVTNIEAQAAFLAEVLDCWLKASGRSEETDNTGLKPQNVVYQGRVLVSVVDLVPAILVDLRQKKLPFVSDEARAEITSWFRLAIDRAGLLRDGKFVAKDEFKELGFLGSGGISRFRNLLWAAAFRRSKIGDLAPEQIAERANKARAEINQYLR